MKIAIIGAAGFIGTNLTISLLKNRNDISKIVLIDSKVDYFDQNPAKDDNRVVIRAFTNEDMYQFDKYLNSALNGVDIVFHLASTTNPSTSNIKISGEITNNVEITVKILDVCVRNNIKRIVFTSSGGTVYGEAVCPISENSATNPINTYGIQKLTVEKLLYLYFYIYNLDYRIIRLSNPYGPYQRPNGKLGAITTFTNKVLHDEKVIVYGDGSVVRDFIYIDDVIKAIINISIKDCKYKLYNVGSGRGTSIKDILELIGNVLDKSIEIEYTPSRSVDLKENYLDISRYKAEFGDIETISLSEGIYKTSKFLMKQKVRS